uniref:Reverse transcriptase zinc-binding domain-containing protein n=1 Tax=Arundo donax TaxID=35708 RepID=A0A0A8YMZ7_ARUDO
MVKWEAVCRPKDQGGLGIINTRLMNECLLVKWIWKICSNNQDIWCGLLKAKYFPHGNLFKSKVMGGSQFWKGLHKVKHLFKWGASYIVGNGKCISFWDDIWIGHTPLRVQFTRLYQICSKPKAWVSKCWNGAEWDIKFRRTFGSTETQLW